MDFKILGKKLRKILLIMIATLLVLFVPAAQNVIYASHRTVHSRSTSGGKHSHKNRKGKSATSKKNEMAEIRNTLDLTTKLHELSVQVVAKAKDKGLRFTFAESCTGGLLAKSITDIAGSSAVFYGSIVSYSDEVKASVLRVCPETLSTLGAVSADCACQMAQGALGVIPSDIAISVTGFAGPSGGTEENPLGTVYFGIATKNGIAKTFKKIFAGTRENIRLQTAATAFETLLAFIDFLKKP